MNSSDNQIFESYVPVYDAVPNEWESARPFITEQLRKITNGLNVREIGFYIDEEVLSGKAFIPGMNNALNGATSQTFRQVLRKVIDFGALPAAGTKIVPHGITFDSNFTLVSLSGAATDPVSLRAIPLPFATPTALNLNVELSMGAINVAVTTGVPGYSAFTRCNIIIEYMQEI